MANDISINLNGKDNASPAINKARQSLQQFAAQSSSVENIAKRFDKIQNSTAPLKKKLKEVQMLMAQLNLQEDANSPIYNQMAQAAGAYRDAIADAAQATNMFANDTMKIQTGIDTMNVFAQAGQIATGVMALFGTENENVTRVIMQLQSVMAIANGVQSIANLLNENSNIILRAKATWQAIVSAAKVKDTVVTTVNTGATVANTAATKLSTIGQMAWNVAKAVGKALLGDFSGLVLVAAAGIGIYAMATDDSTEKQEENNESKEKMISTTEHLASVNAKATEKINDESAKLVSSYKGLQSQFNALGSDVEKAKWLEENKSQFRQLGFEIDNVAEAEDFFNRSSPAVINALMARAEAAALYQMYLEALQKQYKLNHQTTVRWTYTGEKGGEDWKKQRQAAHDNLQQQRDNAKKEVEQIKADWKAAQAKSAAADVKLERFRGGNSGRQGGSGRSNSPKNPKNNPKNPPKNEEEEPKSPEELARELYDAMSNAANQTKEDFARGIIDEKEFKSRLNELNKAFKEEGFKGLELDPDKILKDQAIEALNTKFESVKDKFEHGEMSELDYYANVDDINKKLKELGERPIEITVRTKYEIANSGKRDKANEATSRFSTLQSDFNLGIVGKEDVMKELVEINAILTSIGKEPIEITFTADGIVNAEEKAKELKEKFDALKDSILGKFDGGFTSTLEELQNLKDYLDLGGNAAVAAGAGMQMFGNSLQQIAGDGAAAKAGAILAAVGQLVVSFATAMTSASKNWITWLAFGVTGSAALATIIAQIKSFADGGIIEGNQFRGDAMLARVNAGELILNKTQQGNLFRMLDGGVAAGGGGGRVEFQISGTTLKGVLNNYDKKMDRLR